MAGIPLGSAKGGVICDPYRLSAREQEGICRGWVRQLAKDVGPQCDVPAPDIMTDSVHMLWMLDEFRSHPRRALPGLHHGETRGHGQLSRSYGGSGLQDHLCAA